MRRGPRIPKVITRLSGMTVVTTHLALKVERDRLFDDILRTTDLIKRWAEDDELYATNLRNQKNDSRAKMLHILAEHLDNSKRRMREIDTAINPPTLDDTQALPI